MPSWGIHLKMAKELNKVLDLDKDLFTFGNLLADVDYDTKYSRVKSHYYTGIKYDDYPNECMIDLDTFFNDYKDKLINPLIIGYYAHILTDYFYNTYTFKNKWVYDNNKFIGVRDRYGNLIDSSLDSPHSYKHRDLELYARYIYNYEELFIPTNIDLIYSYCSDLNDNFYSYLDVSNKIEYLIGGSFSIFNELSINEKEDKDSYVVFSKDELDNLFNDCYKFILDKFLEKQIIKK